MKPSVEILEPLEQVLSRNMTADSGQARAVASARQRPREPGPGLHRGKSLRGHDKAHNEDRHFASGTRQHFALFDGLGSARSSASVAAEAANTLAGLRLISRDPQLLSAQIDARLNDLNTRIYDWATPLGLSTGCTLAGLVRADGGALLYAAGDTRAYRYRGGLLTQLTIDHRVFDPVSGLPGVARALGAAAHLSLDMRLIDVRAGDHYLLCTDGVHDTLSHRQLGLIFSLGLEAQEQCALLTEQLLAAQPQDDASFLLVPGAALIQNFTGAPLDGGS